MVAEPKLPPRHSRAYLATKRGLDVLASGLGLVVLSPVFGALAIAVKWDSPGPILFKQQRVGLGREHFVILKFRTMSVQAPADTPTHLLANGASHITRLGGVMRRTSLDELPQLVNVLRGEMSLVGPRPALWNQHDLIAEREKHGANDVKPGLTGWAQVMGRDELSIDDKARLDSEYVQRASFWFDLVCLGKTLRAVVAQWGVSEGGPSQTRTASRN